MTSHTGKMRILCLHGRGSNANVLQTQLAPIIYELGKTKDLEFHFVNAPLSAPPVGGVAEHFDGPFFGFSDTEPSYAQMRSIATSATRKGLSPEDHGRELRQQGMDRTSASTCDFVSQLIRQHTEMPFEGVLGFSEGASVAASYILRQASQHDYPFKFAIFICSIYAFDWRTSLSLLADETSQRVDIPTAHIVGGNDLAYKGSLALFNCCNQSTAGLFDHGGSHGIPWSAAATNGIVQEICSVIERSDSHNKKLVPEMSESSKEEPCVSE